MKKSCISLIIFLAIIYIAYSLGYSRGSDKDLSSNIAKSNDKAIAEEVPTVVSNQELPDAEVINTQTEGTVKHKVEAGETLFLVGLKYDVLWTTIAKANNLDENSALIAGQELIIPLNTSGNVTKEEQENM